MVDTTRSPGTTQSGGCVEADTLEAAGNQKSLACLARSGANHRDVLIRQFLARFGAPAPVTCELFGDEVLRRANALSFGRAQLPTFDLANARHVLSFGADFLGAWNSPVAQASATVRCAAVDPAYADRSCKSNPACRRPVQMPTSGCRPAGH